MKTSDVTLKNIRCFFERLADIPKEEWEYFSENISERFFAKNQMLFEAGECVTDFYFINKGLVRFFYLTEDGKEFNKAFSMENDFVGSFSSMINNAPCRYSVQALEKTESIAIPVSVIQNGFKRHPAWERIGRRHAENVAVKKELREGEFLLDSAEARYRRLLADYPNLIERVQQYHLASYLGITDVALSRIRKKLELT